MSLAGAAWVARVDAPIAGLGPHAGWPADRGYLRCPIACNAATCRAACRQAHVRCERTQSTVMCRPYASKVSGGSGARAVTYWAVPSGKLAGLIESSRSAGATAVLIDGGDDRPDARRSPGCRGGGQTHPPRSNRPNQARLEVALPLRLRLGKGRLDVAVDSCSVTGTARRATQK
jgi:hypothetical protein